MNKNQLIKLLDSLSTDHALSVGSIDRRCRANELIAKIDLYTAALKPLKHKMTACVVQQNSDHVALILAALISDLFLIVVPNYYNEEQAMGMLKDYACDVLISFINGSVTIIPIDGPSQASGSYDKSGLGLLTSGTTGKPKCVCHTLESLTAKIKCADRFHHQRWFCTYPLASFAGIQVLLQAVLNGGVLIIAESLTPSVIYQTLQTFKPDYMNGTPTLMRSFLLAHTPEALQKLSLHRITLGGEMADQTILERIKRYMPKTGITHIYASSEAGAAIQVNDEQAGFSAKLIDGNHFKIEDEQLFIKRSTAAMENYLGKPAQADWIATNDLVKQHGDRILFCGRIDEIINVGGYKVNPQTIENLVLSVDGVEDVIATGRKNPMLGNLVKVEVKTRQGVDTGKIKRNILALAKKTLPEYAGPHIIEFVDEIATSFVNKKKRIIWKK